MNDFERAIKDLGHITKAYKYDLAQKNIEGAVPMPLRTVNQSYKALTFEKSVFDIIHGLESTNEKRLKNINDCEIAVAKSNDVSPWVKDLVRSACDILRLSLSHYQECSSGYFANGNKRNSKNA